MLFSDYESLVVRDVSAAYDEWFMSPSSFSSQLVTSLSKSNASFSCV